jgi:pimeloyl-ACP methyl ester carboxylesterase
MIRETAATLIQSQSLRWLPVAILLMTAPVRAQIAWHSPLHPNHTPPRELISRGTLPPLVQASPLLKAASPDVIWIQCLTPYAASLGGTCGTLPVPLDRRHPNGAKINIYFELYMHTNPGPAQSAILFNAGGPGGSITAVNYLVLAYFAQNLDLHDVLLIDDRGRGQSAAIDCEELQHGTAPFAQAEANCASQLGNTASLYGTGDIAIDTDAVREALGYDKVDYWGGSYGGEDVTAYATRFGQHLRSIVLDAPVGAPALQEAFVVDGEAARDTPRKVRLDCVRSPTCSADHVNPKDEFARLVRTIRAKPIAGPAYDANGLPVQVNIDEGALLYLVSLENEGGMDVGVGEVLAAGDALSQGDLLPLLRLGAEITPLVSDYGDPTAGSQGDYVATLCVDAQQPWDWSEPVPEREEQFADAVSQLPLDQFAPFSKNAGTSLEVSGEKQCLWWQKPTPSSPVTPAHPIYPNVPTLVLSGDLDTEVPAEEVRQVAALFLGSTFISVAEAGHLTVTWTQCAANLQAQFFETLAVGDTSCAMTPETVWPALGRFPLIAADARPADVDPAGVNEIDMTERQVVTVAVATAIDALKRSTIGGGNGVGLRGGNFTSKVNPKSGKQKTMLFGCAFAKDVYVTGTVVWGADRSLSADLTVSREEGGSPHVEGSLHVEGTWEAPGPVGNFRVSGTLGGAAVAVLVPEA